MASENNKKVVKKSHNTMLSKRFNYGDISNWQVMANKETGGNLTLWIELTLNKAINFKSTK